MNKNLKFKIKNSCSGQSLFEVLIALAISALVVSGIVSFAGSSIRNATFARNRASAATYAQAATEWLRGERDKDVAAFIDNSATTEWCLKDLLWSQQGACGANDFISGTPFKRTLIFECVVAGTPCKVLEADVTVSWEDSQGLHEARNTTDFSDWRQR